METTARTSTTSWDEVDDLISLLRAWGITYLVGLEHLADSRSIKVDQIPAVDLIQRLARCNDYPRVRDASISLFLMHPELASAAQQAMQESSPDEAEQIATLVLAALYLQRLWSIRLAMALGHYPGFPEQPFTHLWETRGLPPPTCHNGLCGLLALEEAEQKRTGLPFIFTGDWQNQIDHLLLQEEARHRTIKNLRPLFLLLEETCRNEQESVKSAQIAAFDGEAIESFLEQMGKTFSKSAHPYLVALSQLYRGSSRDIANVKLLAQQGIIDLAELDNAYQEVLAQLGKGRYPRITPKRFIERYQAVRRLL
jgi:hypothetical protein